MSEEEIKELIKKIEEKNNPMECLADISYLVLCEMDDLKCKELWRCYFRVVKKSLEENAELKEQLRLKEVIHTTFIEKNGELVENIEIDKIDVFGGDVKEINEIVVNVANQNVTKYIGIKDIIQIFLQWSYIWGVRKKAIDGYLCAFNTSLEKLKGGDSNE